MAVVPILSDEAAGAEALAVFDDIRAKRNTDYVNNFWRALAADPALLRATWERLQAVMGPGALDPMVKEMIYVAVSVTNGCSYCIHSHTAAARAKGMTERVVVLKHVLRNSLIPVVTVIALGLPTVFGGAIVTEQIFKINGIGAALIGAINVSDLPTVQTLTFIFAVLIVAFNLIADILYGILDPRIRYD